MPSRIVTRVILGAAVGLVVGLGTYTFVYAKGYSYLTNNPQACANCHIMEEQYSGWLKSSHRAVATCNDCHTPHDLVGKYATKASNGFWHSYWFTMGGFHEPIRMTAGNRKITEHACVECHESITADMRTGGHGGAHGGEDISCIRCHSSVGHPTPGGAPGSN
jgi:cytochrome c nitrite reductase small subunit